MSDSNHPLEQPGNNGIPELEQYLRKSVKQYLMPSTFAILMMEFCKRTDTFTDGKALLEDLMVFFEKSNPGVCEKLKTLHTGLYRHEALHPADEEIKGLGTGPVIIGTRTLVGATTPLPFERSVRANMPTPTEEELQELISNAVTLPPPPKKDRPSLAARAELPTLSNEAQIPVAAALPVITMDGNIPDNKDVSEEDEFSSRPTLVEMPSASLIIKSKRPAEDASEVSAETIPADPASAQDGPPVEFGTTEMAWFDEGENIKNGD
jgi:hypothetical protein